MDNVALCKLISQALQSAEAAEVLALAIDQLPEIKLYLGEGWRPYYEKALPRTERDVKRNINKFPQIYHLNLETTDYHNLDEAA